MHWLRDQASFGLFTFEQLTRAIAWLLRQPFDLALEPVLDRLPEGHRPGRDPDLAAAALGRADRHPGADGALRQGPRPRRPGGALLPLSRRVRPVGERHGDARLDRDRGPARRARRPVRRHRRLPPSRLRARGHAAPRSDADRADLRLSGADPLVLRLQPGRGDHRDHHLRDPAHGPQRGPGAPAGAGRGQGFRPDGRLHPAPDDVAGADPIGPALADDRRQPGDHAVPQHGDHRLDDRGGRPRFRRAGRAPPARLRRRARGRDRDHAARDRPRSPVAGLREPPAARARRGRADLSQAPPLPARSARPARGQLADRHRRAGGPDLARSLADHDRRRRQPRHGVDQHPLLRHDRGGQDLAPDPPDGAAQAAAAEPSLDRRGRRRGARGLAAGRLAPRRA